MDIPSRGQPCCFAVDGEHGPGKLPDTGAALGRAIRDFRQAVDGKDDAVAPATTPTQATTTTASDATSGESGKTGSA